MLSLKRIKTFARPPAASRRILAMNGDPDPRNSSFCARLCNAYVSGARSGEWMIRRLNVGDIFSDAPGRSRNDDLEMALADLRWASQLILIFPLLGGEPPPILTDLFQKHAHRSVDLPGGGAHATRMIVTTDMPAFLQREAFLHSAPAQRLFALVPNLSRARQDFIGSIRSMRLEQQSWWLETMREDGVRAV